MVRARGLTPVRTIVIEPHLQWVAPLGSHEAETQVCRLMTAEFAADPSYVTQSRRFVAAHLERWELAALTDVAKLLTGELVANAILHAHSPALVVLAVADGTLEVGVTDQGAYPPDGFRSADVSPDPLADHGRGLMLVDLLAQECGIAVLPVGKQVWFRLDTADWSYRSECRCHGEDLDRVRLESGRYALAIPGPWDSAPS
jgi:anti-sigma regulatory factor (Ser/Thr protein kinase)